MGATAWRWCVVWSRLLCRPIRWLTTIWVRAHGPRGSAPLGVSSTSWSRASFGTGERSRRAPRPGHQSGSRPGLCSAFCAPVREARRPCTTGRVN
eukprot:scaffold110372_cov51-Phaeocystis_antarctica.AAC.1